ncbi:MAG: hypothetical protein M0Q90_02530 [Bacteroidales bacterium]|nr:hypothetical protein [Bacteroidales bacterium]
MKKIMIIGILLVGSILVKAQNEVDALMFSKSHYQGTARSMAMGGAFGALGADFSALSTNPAGLGLYRSSEFTFTPEISTGKTASTYNGMFGEDSRTNLGISNLGFVITNPVKPGSTSTPWKYYQFAFGMNRSNSFNNRSYIRGDNPDNSLVDVYLDNVWDYYPDQIESTFPFDIYPAWYVYVIDTFSVGGLWDYTSPVPQGGIRQQQLQKSWGSSSEWLFSGAANLNDRVFFGATVGMPYVRYFEETRYTEFDVADTIPYFDNWNYNETRETRGWGINLKVGVIAWPIDWLRVGAAFHTPTYFYGLKDVWYTSTDAQLGPDYNRKDSPTGEYEYELSTPLKAIGSIAFIIGKYGSVSADYEIVDYSNMKLRGDRNSFDDANDAIKDIYGSTANLRLGTEWRYSNFNFRAGYSIYGSPYAQKNDDEYKSYSLGIGYSERDFSLDFAYVHGERSRNYYLYSTANFSTNPISQTFTNNQFALTARFRF